MPESRGGTLTGTLKWPATMLQGLLSLKGPCLKLAAENDKAKTLLYLHSYNAVQIQLILVSSYDFTQI